MKRNPIGVDTMTKFDKLVFALRRLYRAVLNRSKHVYPIYARQVARLSRNMGKLVVKAAKAIAIHLVTVEAKLP